MKKKVDVSQKYRKFLLQIRYQKNDYFTVSGADSTDNEDDKVIVDREKKLLLFSQQAALFNAVLHTDSFFDIQLLHQWANEGAGIKKTFAKVNIDILSRRDIKAKNVNLIFDAYCTLGILLDYAIQVNHEELISLLRSDILGEYMDHFANYFLWSPRKEFPFITFSVDYLDTVNLIYHIMGDCITIDPTVKQI